MKSFAYPSGEEVRRGDRIKYPNEPGQVEFVVSEKTGDAAMDWYLQENPRGGFMISAKTFGNVFLTGSETDEDMVFVARATNKDTGRQLVLLIGSDSLPDGVLIPARMHVPFLT